MPEVREVVVYPNPLSNQSEVNVRLLNFDQATIISIYNIQGERVFTHNYIDQAEIAIPMNGKVAGSYFIVITSGEFHEVKQLILTE